VAANFERRHGTLGKRSAGQCGERNSLVFLIELCFERRGFQNGFVISDTKMYNSDAKMYLSDRIA